jgi:transposase
MARAIPVIDAILNGDLATQFGQQHTAHQIWEQLHIEIPGWDVGESTVRAYVRVRKAELGGAGQVSSQIALAWMMTMLHHDVPLPVIEKEFPSGTVSSLMRLIKDGRLRERKKALAVLGRLKGIHAALIARCLQMSRRTVRRYFSRFSNGGINALLSTNRATPKDEPEHTRFLFALLHLPPSSHEINRTSWRMDDLHRIMAESGHRMSKKRIRALIKTAGFRWRKAKIVLTSNDPDYQKKVDAIKQTLSNLKEDEAFFSIDEYGPFAIKRKGGTKRVGPGETYVIPQYQKSKGWLIITAALELSRNQISHFYSLKKNTDEMIKMADLLRAEYRTCRTIYLSWDAASWHISKKLHLHLSEINQHAVPDGFPIVKTAPLPACAQFLNVIESVFSGMAKAVIHNSDYLSAEATKNAINRYFKERNDFFLRNPKRAGRKIWGQERVPSEFSEAHNCKDPGYCRFPERKS